MADDQALYGIPPGGFKQMRIGKLRTLGDINDELTRLYKRFFHGQITSADASRMASVLGIKRQCLIDVAVEKRLDEIEENIAKHSQGTVLPFRTGT